MIKGLAKMNESHIIIAAVVSGVCGTALTILIVILIYWYSKRNKHRDDELLVKDGQSFSTYSSAANLPDSPPKIPADSGGQKKSTPILSKRTIKFTTPGKQMNTETVQPGAESPESAKDSQFEVSIDDLDPRSETGRPLVGAEGGDNGDKTDYKLGRINFTLAYDFQASTLVLKINNAHNLPAKDFSGTSDPYVKVMLLPDKKHKMQTKIKRKNLNPRWNEIFLFEGFPYDKLQTRVLYLEVLDFDRFSRDDPIGEVALPLRDVDLTEEHTFVKELQPCSIARGKLGELLLSLCYQPSVGRITVVILKGRDLKAKDIIGTSDPYVKMWLHHANKRVEKKKTSIKKRTLNPVFNESFIFDVPLDRIRETSLVISVMDYDSLSRNDLIGQIQIGPRSGPAEMKHWNDMIAKPRQAVAQWHLLKM